MFKVVHLQYSTFSAGRAALRLHAAMLEENIDSSILSLQHDLIDTGEIEHLRMRSNIIAWLDGRLQLFLTRNSNRHFGQYTFPFLGTDVTKMDQIKKADIIYLHWVQGGFLNLKNIKKLAKLGKPIIFFMHDMWSITGGCHHSFDCVKYKNKCFDCQMFPNKGIIDWPAWNFKKKRNLYSDFEKLYFVSPSRWLFDCAKKSSLIKDKPVYYIPNIVDWNVFKPFDKKIVREILNLGPDETIIAFGAQSIVSPYKGWTKLQKALELLNNDRNFKKVTVLIFGSGHNRHIADAIPFKTRFMGFLKDEYSTLLIYNAVDVFVTPSLADNLPTTVLESLSCGTAVVGFNVGGIPDMIKHKANGYLAKYHDVEDLANGIRYCLENNIKGQLLPDFEGSKIINKHLELMNSSLSAKN